MPHFHVEEFWTCNGQPVSGRNYGLYTPTVAMALESSAARAEKFRASMEVIEVTYGFLPLTLERIVLKCD